MLLNRVENDQYMSSPMNNRLVYTAPNLGELLNLPLTAFEDYDRVGMFLEAMPQSSGEILKCAGDPNACQVSYRWDHTPIIDGLSPAIVYPGMTATVAIEPKRAVEYKQAGDLPIDLRIDGTSFNLTGFYSEEHNIPGAH